MRKFFELVDDVHSVGRWHLGEVLKRSGDSFEFWGETGMANGESLTAEISHPGRPLDFFLTSFAVPISTAFLGDVIFRIAGRDLQRLPVGIKDRAGYEIWNAVRSIKCLDEARSEFTKWTADDHRSDLAGQYRMVTKLRIDETLVPSDVHFFRMDAWEIALIVSQDVKVEMEAAGCLGAVFYEVTS